jgi:DnaJ-domain-containing protein 1
MAIGRRLFDMARGELNSLLDKAAHLGEDGDSRSTDSDPDGLHAFSEAELEAELERRRLDKELNERIEQAAKRNTSSARPKTTPAPAPDKVARAYAALELKPGSDFATVKSQYRNMMRKYHPDHHTGSPEKEKAAHELTQKLTEAYKLLEERLRAR